MTQLALYPPEQRPTTISRATPYRDETRLGDQIALAGRLATADGLADVFLRLYPAETEAANNYLAAVEQLRKVTR